MLWLKFIVVKGVQAEDSPCCMAVVASSSVCVRHIRCTAGVGAGLVASAFAKRHCITCKKIPDSEICH